MSLWNKKTGQLVRKEFSPFMSLQNEFNDFFDRSFDHPAFASNGAFIPKLEIKETDKAYTVAAELPGMKEDDIHVTLKNNSLVIQGERKNEYKKEEKGFYATEISYGSFYREIPFTAEVNTELAKATYKDGVLTVDVEKKMNAANTRRIAIKKE